jgi:hypothetical protein
MPWSNDTTVQSLRLKYNAAVAAHQSCAQALAEAGLAGNVPTEGLVEKEARARAELDRARQQLHAAMAAVAGRSDALPDR